MINLSTEGNIINTVEVAKHTQMVHSVVFHNDWKNIAQRPKRRPFEYL